MSLYDPKSMLFLLQHTATQRWHKVYCEGAQHLGPYKINKAEMKGCNVWIVHNKNTVIHFLHNKVKRMCLKGKCKNHKVEIRSEKEKIKKNWERHLENIVFYMLKINMALTLRSGISYYTQRKKDMNKDT